MQYKKLGHTDINAPILSFGASVFNNFFKDANFDNSEECNQKLKKMIRKALDSGINYFDVAPWYGNAQYRLAIGLEGIERQKYYLATKVGRYNSDKGSEHWFDFSYTRTIESVENSLKIFNTNYIDLIQVHDFEFAENLNDIVNETLRALDDLRKQGKVKYIGINSYSIKKLKQLLEISTYKIDTVLTYTHLTLDDTSLLEYVDYFRVNETKNMFFYQF
jgi:aryl-alcohol dehydrogenase-like predicted oxidoreductase